MPPERRHLHRAARRDSGLAAWCVAGLAALAVSAPAAAAGEVVEVAVIVHPERPLAGVSSAELERILTLRRQRWEDGERIYLLMQEQGSPEKQIVLDRVYRMSGDELKRFWLGKIHRGELANFPKTLGSNEAVRSFVSRVRNAIGYVDARTLDGTVRALRVDGLFPGADGYRLRSEAAGEGAR